LKRNLADGINLGFNVQEVIDGNESENDIFGI
jgi:hypothetical protein